MSTQTRITAEYCPTCGEVHYPTELGTGEQCTTCRYLPTRGRTVSTRTYDEIHEDLSAAYASWQDVPIVEHRERLRQLWDEIARKASGDRETPGWAVLAAALLRDRYAADLADLRRAALRDLPTKEER